MTLGSSARPLLALSAAAALVAVLGLPSCVDTEGYADGSQELCDLLRACYDYPNCDNHVGGSLDGASSDQRASWLASLTDKGCLSQCSAARRCLNIPPVCLGVQTACQRAEDCCGFLAGKTSCCKVGDAGCPESAEATCCRADGASCTQDAPNLCCSGVCDPRTSTCGGKVCSDLDHSCQNNTDCCSGKCSDNVCVENICTPRGGVCNKDTDICCGGTQCQTSPGSSKGICDFTQTCRGENEQCVVSGGSPDEQCCNQVPCVPIGGPATGKVLGVCNSGSCLPADAPCQDQGSPCCGELSCDPFKQTCGKGCGTTDPSCTAGYECCSGTCQGPLGCKCSDGACQRSEDCCSGSCVKGACAPSCAPTTCHDECKVGEPMPNDGSCLDPVVGDCVSQVCGQDAYCCCVKWDDLCVDESIQTCAAKVCTPG